MVLLAKTPSKRYCRLLLFFALLFIVSKFSFCSEISELSESKQHDPEDENEGISRRPEGATTIPLKKSWFQKFTKETVIDKYYTKDGKKVKVILVRKNRPIFNRLRKWKNKRKMKKKAKKKYKMNRNQKDRKPNLFKRLFKKEKSDNSNTNEPSLVSVNYGKEEESLSKSNIFEDNVESQTNKNENDATNTKNFETPLENSAPTYGLSSYDRNSITGENTESSDVISPTIDYET